MASSLLLHIQITLCILLISLSRASRANVPVSDLVTENSHSIHLATDEIDWRDTTSISIYDGIDEFGIEIDAGEDEISTSVGRRSLFWKRMRYYISYGALAANRVPCPPRSGRSYYTHNCWRARGPVHPYTRGCSAITRCRR